ncbi:hypothetical protein BDR26DRAFT_872693 [Obelidium mucronatum]|nr:hypothetical protein BDR26DRAFT_872693 [Obelidium mucronatum]
MVLIAKSGIAPNDTHDVDRRTLETENDNVLLLAGGSAGHNNFIFANADLLASASDYYRNALSDRYKQSTEIPAEVLDSLIKTSPEMQQRQQLKAVLTHPNVEMNILRLVLKYLYFSVVQIPTDDVNAVALFADEISLSRLVDQCVSHKLRLMTVDSLFETYLLCRDLNRKPRLEVVESGWQSLSEFDTQDMESILLILRKYHWEYRWRLVIGWIKARQGLSDVSAESGIDKSSKALQELSFQIWFDILQQDAELNYSLTSPWFDYCETLLKLIKRYDSIFHDIDIVWGGSLAATKREFFDAKRWGFRLFKWTVDEADGAIVLTESWHSSLEFNEMINLKSLRQIGGASTSKSSEIPHEISNLTNLEYLNLGSHKITGMIPFSIGALVNLTYLLQLNDNCLDGNIPNMIGNLTRLKKLAGNQLSGTIPKSICAIPLLETISLFDNQLVGEIPEAIGNLKQLEQLHLQGNQLTGHLPESLGHLKKLKFIQVQNNCLSGRVPASLGNLKLRLHVLRLENNRLVGPFPSELKKRGFRLDTQAGGLHGWKMLLSRGVGTRS